MNNFNVPLLFEKIHDFISRPILFILLGLMCVAFGVASLILIFHWNKYAVDKSTIIKAQTIYFLGGVFIIAVAFVSIVLY